MTIARKLAVGLAAVLIATLAWAQEAAPEDDVLQRYVLATDSLAEASAALPDDAVAARTALDRAFSALLTLSRGSSSTLAESLDRVFERARTAIENRSATDLAVQTTVLRGGFQRLLYEAALAAAVEGRPDVARERLLRLARDLELGVARLEQIEGETDAGPLRRVLEAGVAEQVAARLAGLADAGAPDDRDAAYRTLSRAYADYLLVQDSGRIDPASNRRFVETAQALVDGDDETYLATLQALSDDLAALRAAADAGTEPTAPTEPSGAVAELPGGAEEPAEPAEPTDAAEAQDAEPAVPAGDAEAAEGTPEPGEIDVEALREEIVAELEAEREAEARAALEADLTQLGLTGDTRSELAERLRLDGVTSVAAIEEALAAAASRLEAAILRGDAVAARDALSDVRRDYLARLAPIATLAAPEGDRQLRTLLDRLDEAPALRASDGALLSSELAALSQRLRRSEAATAHQLTTAAAGLWAGWIRPVTMIVLALLALLPLRLLGLAFGGGNANWRLVGTALFLLVAPLLVEGVISVAALLAAPLAMPSLAGWTMASVFASDLTQMVWALVMLLAILLASFGFYGICVQFGVLGRGRGRGAASPSPVRTRDDTLVDWDDDF